MAKRKRDEAVTGSDLPVKQRQAPDKSAKVETAVTKSKISGKSTQQTTTSHGSSTANSIHDQGSGFQVQIITGSYDKVLHGFAATLPTKAFSKSSDDDTSKQNGHKATDDAPSAAVSFADSFLFTAHSASVRSIAVSQPNESHRRVLATGSADERINLYHVSTAPMKRPSERTVSLLNHSTVENPRNRELGSLLHHSRSVNKLFFPTRGKLFSASEDNTIAISRTRDWTVLSTIKSPVPKPIGRPSGDTAGPGEVPAGVNDFAIHPSMKLMLSVGKGERCMRLWNLVTGKKAGVLNFDKDLLQQAGEGKYSSGEGQKIVWTESGERFVAVFERGAVLFGMVSSSIHLKTEHTLTLLCRTRSQLRSSDLRRRPRCTKYMCYGQHKTMEISSQYQPKTAGLSSSTSTSILSQAMARPRWVKWCTQGAFPLLSSVVRLLACWVVSRTLRF